MFCLFQRTGGRGYFIEIFLSRLDFTLAASVNIPTQMNIAVGVLKTTNGQGLDCIPHAILCCDP